MDTGSHEVRSLGSRLSTVDQLPVQVVFDTAKYPPPNGVGLRDVTSRHILFQTDRHCLDIRVERHPQGTTAELVGQLADRQDPLKPLVDVPVFLMSGERILGQATSNRQGEFQVSYLPERHMALCLPIEDGRVIVVPVDRRMTDRSRDARRRLN